jgi:hypothetical protein
VASWFETRGVAALLTMRVQDLILRSIAKRCVSKDEATELENALKVIPLSGKTPTGGASRGLPLPTRSGMIGARK